MSVTAAAGSCSVAREALMVFHGCAGRNGSLDHQDAHGLKVLDGPLVGALGVGNHEHGAHDGQRLLPPLLPTTETSLNCSCAFGMTELQGLAADTTVAP